MADDITWFDRYVDTLPDRGWFRFLSNWVVVPYWNWREPKPKLPGGPRATMQPTENLQRMMNLIMPLKDPSAVGRARAAIVVAGNVDELFNGLNNAGTVHFARFLIIDGNLCMISTYDGDFSNYVRDFIVTMGSVFDVIMTQVKGGDALIPTVENVDAFIEFVHDHDLFQVPDFPTDLFALQDAAKKIPAGDSHPLGSLPRALILQFHANPNVSLGGGYRACPGVSAAQIRQQFGVGW